MAVNPNYRRNGIGEGLLQGVLGTMKEAGVDLVLLDCLSEAKEARALYGKLEFTVRAEAMVKRLWVVLGGGDMNLIRGTVLSRTVFC
jgi:ribosomal protein S18 acetylase RimI-like enzyme